MQNEFFFFFPLEPPLLKEKMLVTSVAPRDGGKDPSLPPGVSNGRGSLAPFTDFTRGPCPRLPVPFCGISRSRAGGSLLGSVPCVLSAHCLASRCSAVTRVIHTAACPPSIR